MVVIADTTRRLLGNLSELQNLVTRCSRGSRTLCRYGPLFDRRLWKDDLRRFTMATCLSFVGREEEADLLLRRWSKAKTGEGQAVLLSGEAGIGKSRLTAEFLQQISDGRHARVRCFCSPQRTDSALYPSIGQLERAAGFRQGDTAAAKLDKLDGLLARSAASRHDSALLAELLSLPNDGRHPTLTLDPQQRRKRTLEALLTQIEFACPIRTRIDYFRRRALDGSDQPGTARPYRGADHHASGVADHYLPA